MTHYYLLSLPAKELLKTHIGYRTELYSGSGVRDACKVLQYESEVLGNEIELRYEIAQNLDLPEGADLKSVCQQIHNRFGNAAKAVWLGTLETVMRYLDDEPRPSEADQYFIPKTALLVDDLGYDGQLFVMSKNDYDLLMDSRKTILI